MATPTDEDFHRARLIACCILKLDDLKLLGTPEQQAEARGCLETLHDIAHELAGDRVGEIYDKQEMVEEMRRAARWLRIEPDRTSTEEICALAESSDEMTGKNHSFQLGYVSGLLASLMNGEMTMEHAWQRIKAFRLKREAPARMVC